MKKYSLAIGLVSMFAASGAMASGGGSTSNVTTITLAANTYVAVGDVATNINNARQYTFTALASRAGFVKNNFDATLSANVIAGAQDNAATSRFGVVAASNKGYNVFTGSSVGGSVAQCGDQITDKNQTNGAAVLVVAATLNVANANGCGR